MTDMKRLNICLLVVALAVTLGYALTWNPVDQQPAGGIGYDVSIASGEGGTAVYTCVAPAGTDTDARIYKSTDEGSIWESGVPPVAWTPR